MKLNLLRGDIKLLKLMSEQYGQSKSSFYIYMILRLIVIAIIIISILNKHYEYLAQAFLALVFFCLPPFFERAFKADLPTIFEIIVLFFIFSANILGEIFSFYVKFPGWDTMLHTIYGFMCAALGFSLFDLLNKDLDSNAKFSMSRNFLCTFSVGFTMLVAVLWEFVEFGMDNLFGKDMQKDTIIKGFQTVMLDDTNSNIAIPVHDITSVTVDPYGTFPFNGYLDIGLYDTMKDMGVALLGAVIFCFFLNAYLKSNGQNKVAATLIPTRRNWDVEPPEIEADLAKRIANLPEINEKEDNKDDK